MLDVALSDIASSMLSFKTLAQALPRFYLKTGLSANISFQNAPEEDGIDLQLSFSPRLPTDEEWNSFLEELMDSEKFLISENVLNSLKGCENINQVIFKYKEEVNEIIFKRKNENKN